MLGSVRVKSEKREYCVIKVLYGSTNIITIEEELRQRRSLCPHLEVLLDCLGNSLQTLESCDCVSRGQGGERVGGCRAGGEITQEFGKLNDIVFVA